MAKRRTTEDDDRILVAVTQLRERNNRLWMALVKLALKQKGSRVILAAITANDRKISKCLRKLSGH